MRIAIHTLGTRGDLQPYLALALRLIERGHVVRLAGPEQFAGLAATHRVDYHPLPGDFLALIDSAEGKQAIAGGAGFSAGLKLLRHVRPMIRRLFDAERESAFPLRADVIVHHPKSIVAPDLAEAIGCRSILASPLPGFTVTSAFPSPMLPFADLGPLNRVSHLVAIHGANLLFRSALRDFRQALGLPARRAAGVRAGTLYAYSGHVVPVPPDWGHDVCVSGYWFLDSPRWSPPPALLDFLGRGEPPVYVGFGSMPGLDPEATSRLVVEALRMAGRRGIIATGGGALAAVPASDTVLFIDGAPHDWLLARVRSAIHHGGAGTTAACLRAGKPNAICPFFGDQPFWARRNQALGTGPHALDRKALTPRAIAEAIVAMDDPAMRTRAEELSSELRSEDGTGTAAHFIEERVR